MMYLNTNRPSSNQFEENPDPDPDPDPDLSQMIMKNVDLDLDSIPIPIKEQIQVNILAGLFSFICYLISIGKRIYFELILTVYIYIFANHRQGNKENSDEIEGNNNDDDDESTDSPLL